MLSFKIEFICVIADLNLDSSHSLGIRSAMLGFIFYFGKFLQAISSFEAMDIIVR